jgi:hypothetical protein
VRWPRFLWPSLTLFICLIPWCFNIVQKALNHDVIWFITGAKLWLSGQGLEQTFIDPNPPLAFLFYLPVVVLKNWLGLSWESGAIVQTLIFLLLSATGFFILTRKLVDNANAFFLTLVLILCGTLIDFPDFAQRDEFIGLGLAVFLIGQIILTQRLAAPKIVLWAVFLCGALTIWLRPHFGVIPVGMLIHRMYVQKRWDIWKDIDFIALTIVSMAYLAGIYIFFPDFLRLLPDLLKLYVPGDQRASVLHQGLIFGLFYGWLIIITLLLDKKGNGVSNLCLAFLLAGLACLFIYVIQLRPYSYHLLPSWTFLWLGIGQMLFQTGQKLTTQTKASVGILILISSVAYVIYPLESYPTRQQMRNHPLTKTIAACGQDCGFFIIADGRIGPLVPYYAEKVHASRFNGAWFLISLMHQKELINAGKPALIDRAEYDHLFKRYSGYIVDDLKYYPDSIIAVCDSKYYPAFSYDFIKYLSDSHAFRTVWKDYKPTKITVDYSVFDPSKKHSEHPSDSLLSCRLYKRSKDKSSSSAY